jgi:hypothetical protein
MASGNDLLAADLVLFFTLDSFHRDSHFHGPLDFSGCHFTSTVTLLTGHFIAHPGTNSSYTPEAVTTGKSPPV